MTCPEKLAEAKKEFLQRTGGGVGGTKWLAPLLPSDHPAPINFRWPEYVNTARADNEWWIPKQ